jgi:hypothetical protein
MVAPTVTEITRLSPHRREDAPPSQRPLVVASLIACPKAKSADAPQR